MSLHYSMHEKLEWVAALGVMDEGRPRTITPQSVKVLENSLRTHTGVWLVVGRRLALGAKQDTSAEAVSQRRERRHGAVARMALYEHRNDYTF